MSWNIYGITFKAGFGLWQEHTHYINTIKFGLRQDFKYLSYELEVPIFIPFDHSIFTFGVFNEENSPAFKNLANISYISNFIKEISYQNKNIKIGLMKKTPHFQNIQIWGNPLLNNNTPFIGSNFYINTNYINFYTSALPDPSIMLINTHSRPFSNSKKYIWLNTLNIELSSYLDTYLDLNFPPHWGAGIDLQTTYWQHQKHSLGLIGAISYANTLLRSTLLLFYGFGDLEIGLGSIIQDQNHLNSPPLSPLYPILREKIATRHSNNSYITGGSFFLNWEANNTHFFNFYFDLYKRNILITSYRINYYFRFKNIYWGISHIRNSIESFKNFINFKTATSFFGSELKVKLIHNFFEIGWESYLSSDEDFIVKSRLYTHLIF